MRILRWLLYVLGGLVVVVLVAATGVYGVSSWRLGSSYSVPPENVAIPGDATSLERGKHLAVAIGKCPDCHGDNLGGKVFIDAPPVGRYAAVNLTRGRGGVAGQLKDADWVRAIRHGVGPDGKGLRFMPSGEFYYFSDADLGALVAYLKNLPPVDSDLPSTTVGPLARVFFLTGQFPDLLPAAAINHAAPHPTAPAPGVTIDYGRYLAQTGGCVGCHGPGLSGGHVPGTPPDFPDAANITPTGLGVWSEQDFFTALREGKRPGGTAINAFMPWKATAQMSDDEIKALWLYLKSVPRRPTGTR